MKVGTNCSNGLSGLCLSVSLTPAFHLSSVPGSGCSISLGCEMLVPGACRDGGAQINNSVCGVGPYKTSPEGPEEVWSGNNNCQDPKQVLGGRSRGMLSVPC